VAKFNPAKFMQEVRAETARVIWPTGRETMMTTIMVMIMASFLGVFFLGVDRVFQWVVKSLLNLV
jgi:preprotein translocase subunit SecE